MAPENGGFLQQCRLNIEWNPIVNVGMNGSTQRREMFSQ